MNNTQPKKSKVDIQYVIFAIILVLVLVIFLMATRKNDGPTTNSQNSLRSIEERVQKSTRKSATAMGYPQRGFFQSDASWEQQKRDWTQEELKRTGQGLGKLFNSHPAMQVSAADREAAKKRAEEKAKEEPGEYSPLRFK